nr:hypothetical protein [Tanacetum cinerariifolium]
RPDFFLGFEALIRSVMKFSASVTVLERSTALWIARMTGSMAETQSRTADVRTSGFDLHKTLVSSSRSRMESEADPVGHGGDGELGQDEADHGVDHGGGVADAEGLLDHVVGNELVDVLEEAHEV